MNTWYPDATAEELAATDNICIICREEMLAPSTKKLPCNHIFHKSCLRSWFQRQQTCPTCRLDILRAPVPGGTGQRDQQRPGGQHAQQQRAGQHAQAQQAGVQPQQQPQQQPPLPPNINPIFAQFIAANARLAFPPTPPPAATAPVTSASASASGTTSSFTTTTAQSGQNSAANFAAPPFFPPPMFMPPFNVPPPMPPQNFAGLTETELRAMEGNERVNVEARIRCLRNIQVLLDAAVMEMQQYSAVVSQQDFNRNVSNAARSAAAAASTSATSGSASTSTATATAVTSVTTTATTATTASPPSASVNYNGSLVTTATSASTEQSTATFTSPEQTGARPKTSAKNDELAPAETSDDPNAAEAASDEQTEVRRRRLEKFANANTADNSS